MVERDRRDQRCQRLIDDIGGIEPAAQSDLEQQHVGGMACEQQEGGGGGDLEHRDRRAGIGALAVLEHVAELLVGGQPSAAGGAEAEALVEAHEMRRGIDMNALTAGLEDRAHESDGGALAVGAGDMDHRRQSAFGMAERGEQAPHPVEREIDAFGMQRGEPRNEGRRDS